MRDETWSTLVFVLFLAALVRMTCYVLEGP